MSITKDQFLARRPRKTKLIEISDFGAVNISIMTAREKEDFESWVLANKDNTSGANIRARLVCLSVVDDTGQRMFDERDVESIGDIDSHTIETLFAEILALNAFTKSDAEKLLKNSEPDRVAASN